MPWSTDPQDSYRPIPPWRNATGSLATEIENSLDAELGGPVGQILFIAKSSPSPDQDTTTKIHQALAPQLNFTGRDRGSLKTISYQGIAGRSFSMDSQGSRLESVHLHQHRLWITEQLGAEILAACSIPPDF